MYDKIITPGSNQNIDPFCPYKTEPQPYAPPERCWEGQITEQETIQWPPPQAKRSNDADNVRYDLITPVGLRRLAETYREGCEKYGDHNWRNATKDNKGFQFSDLINHAINHIYLYLMGDNAEDHLAHAVWNLMTLMHFEEERPELNDIRTVIGDRQKFNKVSPKE